MIATAACRVVDLGVTKFGLLEASAERIWGSVNTGACRAKNMHHTRVRWIVPPAEEAIEL